MKTQSNKKTGSAGQTLAERIVKASGLLSKYFTSSEVMGAIQRTYRGTLHRGAVNAAIASLQKNRVVEIVRQGAGRRDTIWSLCQHRHA